MVGKRLVNTGGVVEAFDPLKNFETVTYTGNGGTQKITGYIRKGAAFNGTSYIQMPTFISNTSNNTDFSVSVWINPSDVSGFKSLIGHPNSTNRSPLALSLYFGGNGSTAYFSLERGFGGTVYYAGSYGSAIGATINANQWYHLVFT